MPVAYRPFPSLSLLSEEAESGPWRSSSHIASSVSDAGRDPAAGMRRSTSRGFALLKVALMSCAQRMFWDLGQWKSVCVRPDLDLPAADLGSQQGFVVQLEVSLSDGGVR